MVSRKTPDQFLREHSEVKFIRLQWVDYSGVFHCRLVTAAKCMRMSNSTRAYKVPVNAMCVPLSTAPSCDVSPPQVWELCPDWNTLRICGFTPAHAFVMCFLTRTGAADPFAMCPRHILTNVVEALEQEFDDQRPAYACVCFPRDFWR